MAYVAIMASAVYEAPTIKEVVQVEMSKRRFFKTTFEVCVLSENQHTADMELKDLARECSTGALVGTLDVQLITKLDGREAAQALLFAGSEPGFFRLTEDGEDA